MRSNTYTLEQFEKDYDRIPAEAEKVAVYNSLAPKAALRLRLLTEELICMLPQLLTYGDGKFWIENEGTDYELHLSVNAKDHFDYDIDKVLSVSSTGKNAAAKGIINKICIAVDCMLNDRARLAKEDPYTFYTMGMTDHSGSMSWSLMSYKNNLDQNTEDFHEEEAWDELEKSIIANLADDVVVGVLGRKIDIVIKKTF